jgi:hypothetical protein
MDLRLRMSGVSDLLFQGTSPNLNNGRERSPHGPLIAALAGLELPFVCRCSSGLNGTATSRKQIEESAFAVYELRAYSPYSAGWRRCSSSTRAKAARARQARRE